MKLNKLKPSTVFITLFFIIGLVFTCSLLIGSALSKGNKPEPTKCPTILEIESNEVLRIPTQYEHFSKETCHDLMDFQGQMDRSGGASDTFTVIDFSIISSGHFAPFEIFQPTKDIVFNDDFAITNYLLLTTNASKYFMNPMQTHYKRTVRTSWIKPVVILTVTGYSDLFLSNTLLIAYSNVYRYKLRTLNLTTNELSVILNRILRWRDMK